MAQLRRRPDQFSMVSCSVFYPESEGPPMSPSSGYFRFFVPVRHAGAPFRLSLPVSFVLLSWSTISLAFSNGSPFSLRRVRRAAGPAGAPAVHVAGDWVTVRESTCEEEGLRWRYCTVYGNILEEETIPRLIYVSSCEADSAALALIYRSSARLSAEILPEDASDIVARMNLLRRRRATVDAQDNVYAAGRREPPSLPALWMTATPRASAKSP